MVGAHQRVNYQDLKLHSTDIEIYVRYVRLLELELELF